jgi:D-glycero-alpha-D-manno-heptose-7-phosphate kinase
VIIQRTPLRITFTGGGSDIPSFFYKSEGHCINATIDKYVYVLVKKRFDDKIYLKYSENEVVDCIDDIKHDFIRETLKFMKIDYGLEIINWADIPTKGTGLGSSSSFLVGLLNALHTLNGDKPTKEQVAKEACHIEVTKCGKPIGYQDQFAAAHGGVNQMIFKQDVKSGDRRDVQKFCFSDHELSDISNRLMLFYTGITRESDAVLTDQNKNMESDESVFFAMKENVTTSEWLAEELMNKRFFSISEGLKKNWELKKRFSSKMTNKKIDELYHLGIVNGAQSGKILGAGGGGFVMFYVDPLNRHKLFNALSNSYKHMPFTIDPYGSRVLLNTEEKSW